MNKTQLVDALAERLGDRRTAATAVDGLLETIVETVRGGDSVSITGFGVFEGRARAARTARNPRTGEPISISATTVPAFRPGATFRTAVGGGSASAQAAPAAPAAAAKPASRRAKASTSFTAAAPSKAAKNGSEKDDSKNGTEKNGTGKNGKDKAPKGKAAKADKSEKAAKADKGKKASKGKK